MIAESLDLPRGDDADKGKQDHYTHVVTWWDPTLGQWEEEGFGNEDRALDHADELAKQAPERTFHIVAVQAQSYVYRQQ